MSSPPLSFLQCEASCLLLRLIVEALALPLGICGVVMGAKVIGYVDVQKIIAIGFMVNPLTVGLNST